MKNSYMRLLDKKTIDSLTSVFDMCNGCGRMRERLTFEEMPEKMREAFKDMPFKVGYYLYCKKCDEYSVVSIPEIG